VLPENGQQTFGDESMRDFAGHALPERDRNSPFCMLHVHEEFGLQNQIRQENQEFPDGGSDGRGG
jgi:hypothetical protein